MGVLQRAGMKAELRRLQPFFTADERFVETDVCELVAMVDNETGQRSNSERVAVTLTNRAVYLRWLNASQSVLRVPYERILDLAASPGVVELVTRRFNYLIREIGRAMGGDKFVFISAQIARLENHREVVDVPGGRVEALNRAMEEDSPPVWQLRCTEGVDLQDPATQQELRQQLTQPIARFGDLRF